MQIIFLVWVCKENAQLYFPRPEKCSELFIPVIYNTIYLYTNNSIYFICLYTLLYTVISILFFPQQKKYTRYYENVSLITQLLCKGNLSQTFFFQIFKKESMLLPKIFLIMLKLNSAVFNWGKVSFKKIIVEIGLHNFHHSYGQRSFPHPLAVQQH